VIDNRAARLSEVVLVFSKGKTVKRVSFFKPAIVILFLSIFFQACQQRPPAAGEADRGGLVARAKGSQSFLQVNSVALAPVEIDRSVREVVNNDKEFLSLLHQAATEGSEFEVIPEKVVAEAFKGMQGPVTPESAAGLARRTGADAVLVTRLLRYEERKGSRVGANNPARVGFSMTLYGARDGAALWDGSFHFGDKALSEDLLRLRDEREGQGAGWHTARELLSSGFKAALKDIASRRRSAFLGG
jgi:hypothetical protein